MNLLNISLYVIIVLLLSLSVYIVLTPDAKITKWIEAFFDNNTRMKETKKTETKKEEKMEGTNVDEREYDEKFSGALNAIVIMNSTIDMIEKDIDHLGKRLGKNGDTFGTYGKASLKRDFEQLKKAYKKQSEYMLEMSKEIQKTYKMY